jgi:hypothetical protein
VIAPAASKRALARTDGANTERFLGTLAADISAGMLGVTTFVSAGAPIFNAYTRIGSAIFLSCIKPRSLTASSRRPFT